MPKISPLESLLMEHQFLQRAYANDLTLNEDTAAVRQFKAHYAALKAQLREAVRLLNQVWVNDTANDYSGVGEFLAQHADIVKEQK